MAQGPLHHIKVLEYCEFVSGPYCTKLLADMGAEVIKIERPDGDSARKREPFPGDVPNPETSGLFLYLNTNKKGITLNLETVSGQRILRELIRETDIFVEDTAPGYLQSLGLDYERLKQENENLIMLSLTPFGQTGPYRDFKAYYLNIYHASGAGYVLPAASPNADREPIKGGGYVGECDCGAYAAVSLLAAVFWRNAGGKGQYIDVSRQEALMCLERMNIVRYYMIGEIPTRVGVNRVRDTLLKCRDGGYIIVVLYPQNQWEGLMRAFGNPEWSQHEPFLEQKERDRHFEEIKAHLREAALQYDTEELFSKIQAEGTACAPICSAEQVYHSPQTQARQFFTPIDHPAAGKLMYPGLPYKFSTMTPSGNFGAPLLGQHNEEIYAEQLGYTKKQLVRFREAGVI